MPYRVPDSFFADVENDIIAGTCSRHKKYNILKVTYGSVAVAAILALIFFVGNSDDTLLQSTDFAEVAQAFDNLTDADQTYLLEIYQDDIFINE